MPVGKNTSQILFRTIAAVAGACHKQKHGCLIFSYAANVSTYYGIRYAFSLRNSIPGSLHICRESDSVPLHTALQIIPQNLTYLRICSKESLAARHRHRQFVYGNIKPVLFFNLFQAGCAAFFVGIIGLESVIRNPGLSQF